MEHFLNWYIFLAVSFMLRHHVSRRTRMKPLRYHLPAIAAAALRGSPGVRHGFATIRRRQAGGDRQALVRGGGMAGARTTFDVDKAFIASPALAEKIGENTGFSGVLVAFAIFSVSETVSTGFPG
jgi:hypothetical protein